MTLESKQQLQRKENTGTDLPTLVSLTSINDILDNNDGLLLVNVFAYVSSFVDRTPVSVTYSKKKFNGRIQVSLNSFDTSHDNSKHILLNMWGFEDG